LNPLIFISESALIMESTLGKFIVLEGPDGCGKSTWTPYVVESLNAKGIPAIATREVGSTSLGGLLRNIVYGNHPFPEETLDPVSRLLLIYAARIQNIRCIVEPNLKQGITVVSDRFTDSTFVYQGMEDKLNFLIKDMESIVEMRFIAQRPDHLLYLHISPETSMARGKTRGEVDNTLYKGNYDRAQRIVDNYRARFLKMKELHPDKEIVSVNAEQPMGLVKQELDAFIARFAEKQLQAMKKTKTVTHCA
jgi:dTMP kinase